MRGSRGAYTPRGGGAVNSQQAASGLVISNVSEIQTCCHGDEDDLVDLDDLDDLDYLDHDNDSAGEQFVRGSKFTCRRRDQPTAGDQYSQVLKDKYSQVFSFYSRTVVYYSNV